MNIINFIIKLFKNISKLIFFLFILITLVDVHLKICNVCENKNFLSKI